jgi:phosphoserine/homoserine phosphotransferase
MSLPSLIAFDLEGVFLPEIWIAVAERTGLPALRRTTRDEPDYDRLMRGRMQILEQHGLTLADIQQVIASMEPLPGAVEFLAWVRQRTQMVILTDSFYEFVAPFLPKLGWPTVFAHTLEVDARGMLTGYRLRIPDGKRKAVEALRSLGFRTAAVGDSYNDTTMLAAADQGILFRPPENVVHDFPTSQWREPTMNCAASWNVSFAKFRRSLKILLCSCILFLACARSCTYRSRILESIR